MNKLFYIFPLLILLFGFDSKNDIDFIEGELAPNLKSLNNGEPLKDIWTKIHDTNSQEVWVDSTNQIIVFRKNGIATLVYSDIDGVAFVDLFKNSEHLLTAEVADEGDRSIVYRKDEEGQSWWYVDKDLDGIVDVRFMPGTSGKSEKLKNKDFIKNVSD